MLITNNNNNWYTIMRRVFVIQVKIIANISFVWRLFQDSDDTGTTIPRKIGNNLQADEMYQVYGNGNLKATIPSTDYDGTKTNWRIWNISTILGSVITNVVRRASQIKSRISLTTAEFHKKKNRFTRKLHLNIRKK